MSLAIIIVIGHATDLAPHLSLGRGPDLAIVRGFDVTFALSLGLGVVLVLVIVIIVVYVCTRSHVLVLVLVCARAHAVVCVFVIASLLSL